jgi:AcrR family transcriptional regulator
MSIVVEHDKRRKQILKKALDVFMEEGFEDATYQKIADRCKITRTTLYLYFRNREEIFNFSIKQFMSEVEFDILGVKENQSYSYPAKIKKMLFLILSRLEENRLLLSVILDYLLSKSGGFSKTKTGKDRISTQADTSVRRRTIRLRRLLSAMLIEGIKNGELKKVDVAAANNLLYSLIEAAIFQLTVLKTESAAELKEAVEQAVNGLVP